jgi:hypothetical protein
VTCNVLGNQRTETQTNTEWKTNNSLKLHNDTQRLPYCHQQNQSKKKKNTSDAHKLMERGMFSMAHITCHQPYVTFTQNALAFTAMRSGNLNKYHNEL